MVLLWRSMNLKLGSARSCSTAADGRHLDLVDGGCGGFGGLDDGAVQPVGDLVGEGHLDLLKADGGQTLLVLVLGERAGDAAHVAAALGTVIRGEAILGDDVADADPAAWLKDAVDLGEHGRLVDRQVDHAVGDHHVDRGGGQGDLLDVALEEGDVAGAGLVSVAAGEGEHLLGHVQPVGMAGGTDPLGGQQHVDAATGAEVQHHLALAEVGDGGGIAATQAGQQRSLRQGVLVADGVEVGAEAGTLGPGDATGVAAGAVAATVGGLAAAAAAVGGLSAGGGLAGGRGVELADLLPQLLGVVGVGGAHGRSPWRPTTAARRRSASDRSE
jgi:hypothetical protein